MSGLLLFILGCKTEKEPQETVPPELIEAFADAGEDFSVVIGETARFYAGQSQGIELSWNFGDGETASNGDAEHIFDEVGRYQAVLTAIGSDGARDSDAISVIVHNPLTENPPLTSSTMITVEDSLWAIVEEAGTLTKLNRETQETTIFEICERPRSLAHQDNMIAVTCAKDATLAFFNIETEEHSFFALPENSLPHGIVGRAGSWWIALSGTGELAALSQELNIYPIGADLRGISLLSDNRVLLPRWRSHSTQAEVYIWDGTAVETIALGIDYSGDSDNTTGGLPNILHNIYPSPDGSTLLAPFSHANIIRGEYLSGEVLNHETSLRGILGFIDMESQTETPEQRKHFDETGQASAIAWSPLGDIIYVLHSSNGTLTILNAYNKQIMGSVLEIGNMPIDLKLAEDGETLFIYSWLDREIIAYDVSNSTQVTELWRKSIIDEEPLEAEILRGKKLFYSASDKRITRSGYISCGACHPDGSHDGQTWDFTDRGEGLRNTTSLLGRAGMGMGRLHWSGNFDEVQDFENDIREAFGGKGFLSDEDWAETADTLGEEKAGRSTDLDALAAFVATLSEITPSPYEIDEIDEVGELNFNMLGCADCHPAPLYTDSDTMIPIRHDVGTIQESSGGRLGGELDGLDTPTLLGLWNSGPYLHDGRAQTISESISAHDGYEELSPEILSSIENFLLSL